MKPTIQRTHRPQPPPRRKTTPADQARRRRALAAVCRRAPDRRRLAATAATLHAGGIRRVGEEADPARRRSALLLRSGTIRLRAAQTPGGARGEEPGGASAQLGRIQQEASIARSEIGSASRTAGKSPATPVWCRARIPRASGASAARSPRSLIFQRNPASGGLRPAPTSAAICRQPVVAAQRR